MWTFIGNIAGSWALFFENRDEYELVRYKMYIYLRVLLASSIKHN